MKKQTIIVKILTAALYASMLLAGCSSAAPASDSDAAVIHADVQQSGNDEADGSSVTEKGTGETFANDEDGAHAIEADGVTAEYSNATVTKTGEADGDEADFYGENSAIFATNGAKLTLSNMNISTNGTHANAVFSYGEGTVVDISNSTIETSGNCSGGLMTTGGGTMNASNLTIHTTGNSSAAIRSDRGGGVVTVNGGNYTTEGTGSPAIYSTADITVNDASLTSTTSQGVVVEGRNSVTLNNVVLNASNTTKNSDKSDYYQAVMIYQSMSGDADTGLSEFTAKGGSISNTNGDIIFVNNTATNISLTDVDITNNGGGVFLRAAAAGWGRGGENGGKVNLTASDQTINGDLLADDVSILNLYLQDGSTLTGAVNPDGEAGDVYVELTGGSKWTLTGNSYISSLTCDADSIDLNGYTLMVAGKEYTAGTVSAGEPVEIEISEGNAMSPDGNEPPEMNGEPPQKPDGEMPQATDGEPPQKPDGEMTQAPNGEPPQKPNGEPPQKPDGEPPQ